MTTITTTLTDRYVHATLREVPEDRRQDLGDELRSTIDDMVEARVAAGEGRTEAERAALSELGDPVRLAAQYSGARLQLLGPRFFPTWKRITVQLLTWVPALVATVVAAVEVLDGGSTVGEVVIEACSTAIGTAIQLVFWTTLVFVLLDRFTTDEPAAWTPDALPEAPVSREYSFGDAASSIAFNLVLAAAIVLQHFRSWVPGEDGGDVAVLDPALWSGWLPFLLVVTAAVIGLEVWKYSRGWTLGAVVATVVTSVAFSAPVAWLATEDRLLNPEFLDVVELGSTGQDGLAVAIAAGAVLVAAWEIGEAVVSAARARAAR